MLILVALLATQSPLLDEQILVTRATDAATFQLTTTLFGLEVKTPSRGDRALTEIAGPTLAGTWALDAGLGLDMRLAAKHGGFTMSRDDVDDLEIAPTLGVEVGVSYAFDALSARVVTVFENGEPNLVVEAEWSLDAFGLSLAVENFTRDSIAARVETSLTF